MNEKRKGSRNELRTIILSESDPRTFVLVKSNRSPLEAEMERAYAVHMVLCWCKW